MSRASEYLLTQYHSRSLKNPRYSKRAFASLLEINSGRLSQYFSGQRDISFRAAKAIASKLALDAAETNYFFHLLEQDKVERKSVGKILTDDEIALVVEWYHAAVMSLLTTQDFKSDPKWMAERLQLPVEVIQSSLERLARIGIIDMSQQGIRPARGPIKARASKIPSDFILRSHQDILRKVTTDLPYVPPENRDVTSVTFPMNIQNLPEARKHIEEFRLKMAKRYSKGDTNEVMALNIQLFPFSKVRP